MNTTLSKKEIRRNLEDALMNEIKKMDGGGESSKKVKRALRKFSKDIALKVKLDMKKKLRAAAKRMKKSKHVNELTDHLMENGVEKVEFASN